MAKDTPQLRDFRGGRVTSYQRAYAIQLAADRGATMGLGEANVECAKYDPPFQLTSRQWTHCKKRAGVLMREKLAEMQRVAVAAGLELKEARIEKLKSLFER